MSESKKLRLITYLSPGVPVGVFEAVRDYLEERTGREAYLVYESRWTGPPRDRGNPFSDDEVDIGFMDSTDYLRLVQDRKSGAELCGAGPVQIHEKNTERPVRYSDIIINAANKKKFKELHDLRGHSFGFSSQNSPTGSLAMLDHLRKTGFDASFFGDKYESGSHLASIQAVLDNRVDAAAVDSGVLAGFLTSHSYHKEELHTLLSLGPLPPYAIVFNSKMSDDLKQQITEALLHMTESSQWGSVLKSHHMAGFAAMDSSVFDTEKELQTSLKGKRMNATYY